MKKVLDLQNGIKVLSMRLNSVLKETAACAWLREKSFKLTSESIFLVESRLVFRVMLVDWSVG